MRALWVALAVWPLAAAAQPEMRGPLAVDLWEPGAVDAAGTPIPVHVYYSPDAHGPGPVVAVVHGWLRNAGYMRELASDLASRGFVAVAPDMPCGALGCDHAANAAQISGLLEWAVAQGAADTPIHGRVDGERRAVVGHSWGGLAVFLAGAQDPRIRTVVCLDPNDDNGVAAAAAAQVRVPSAYLFAENKGACNTAWMPQTYADTAAPHLRLTVRRSGHCDVEDPTDGLCPLACGPGDPATTPYFRRYAVAWLACVMNRDASMAPWLGGASLDADVGADAIGDVDHSGLEALPCRAMAVTDAGVPDAAARPDAAPRDATVPDAAPRDAIAPDATPRDATVPDAAPALPDAARPDAARPDAARPDAADIDGGVESGPQRSDGCAQAPTGPAPWPLLALLALRRRRAR